MSLDGGLELAPSHAIASSRSFDRAGFRYRFACAPLGVPSRAVGVGNDRSEIGASITVKPPPLASDVRGVGSIFVTASVSVSPAWTPVGGIFERFAVLFLAAFESPTVGVGSVCTTIERGRKEASRPSCLRSRSW